MFCRRRDPPQGIFWTPFGAVMSCFGAGLGLFWTCFWALVDRCVKDSTLCISRTCIFELCPTMLRVDPKCVVRYADALKCRCIFRKAPNRTGSRLTRRIRTGNRGTRAPIGTAGTGTGSNPRTGGTGTQNLQPT